MSGIVLLLDVVTSQICIKYHIRLGGFWNVREFCTCPIPEINISLIYFEIKKKKNIVKDIINQLKYKSDVSFNL